MAGTMALVCVGPGADSVRRCWQGSLLQSPVEYPSLAEALECGLDTVVVCGDVLDAIGELSGVQKALLSRVVVACACATPSALRTLLDFGVRGWLSGTEEEAQSRAIDAQVTESDIGELAPPVRILEQDFKVKVRDHVASLTATQFRILKLLVTRAGQWTSPSLIVAEAVGTHHRSDSSLVRVHVHVHPPRARALVIAHRDELAPVAWLSYRKSGRRARIKWIKASNPLGVPVWSQAGIVCTGEAYKQAVKLTFARGAALPDPGKLFNSSLEGGTRRAIDIRQGDVLDPLAFKELIEHAIAENVRATERA